MVTPRGVSRRMKLMIFSGTTEGHDLCRFLSKNNVQAEVFVATEYGAAVMEPMAGITVHEGRLDEREMEKRLTSDTLLIDATHPYAAAVTDNLRAACAKSGARYERLLRPALPYPCRWHGPRPYGIACVLHDDFTSSKSRLTMPGS